MSLGKFAALDKDTQTRINAACSYVNHKIAAQRQRLLNVVVPTVVLAASIWVFGQLDFRIPLGIVLVVTLPMLAYTQHQIKKLYKSVVVPRIVEAMGNGLSYSAESSFDKDAFRAMDLYSGSIDRFSSEDQVSGKLQNVAYTLREMHAERREGSGKNQHYVTVFKGMIVTLEFNKNFQGQTVVVPDREGKHLGLFGEKDSRDGKQRVSLADAEFENAYACFSTNDQEANYLLTPKLMQLIMKARAALDEDVRLSFMNNMLYVSVPSSRDHFEVSLFTSSVTPDAVIGDLADVVHLAEQLIESLDLETRIWSRV